MAAPESGAAAEILVYLRGSACALAAAQYGSRASAGGRLSEEELDRLLGELTSEEDSEW